MSAAATEAQPRRLRRAGLSTAQRLNFVDDDQDVFEAAVAELRGLLIRLLFAVLGLTFAILSGVAVALVTR